ncbi:MAG: methylated-DNA--[protein]-cysteine S-methyltransferase [Bacteroidetes bacterium]|nr:methylated-DNA--[protein]-cysteine S-methyltransferase [Bacteroidota bacterium]
MVRISLATPIGFLIVAGNETHIREAYFSDRPFPDEGGLAAWINEVRIQSEDYFSGKLTQFNLPFDLKGTAFQRSVWAVVSQIPFGETRTYLEIAETLGNTKLTRAVGQANAHNPCLLFIPCHRVIGGTGNLTGYAGGTDRKFWLLKHENSPGFKIIQLTLFNSSDGI